MKEFKYCHEEITEGVEIPVTVCETQKELLSEISAIIRDVRDMGMNEEESIYIIYKDGSKYFIHDEGEAGKFKRYGIKSAVYEHVNGYVVFGDFAITDIGDVSIDEFDIEEYGIYAGQYDVKEQGEQEVQETVEQTETETNEITAETTAERQKDEVIAMKTKTYKAAVTNKETGKLEVITRDDYTSKKDFAHDLRVNGYAVRFISTSEKFDEDCENYYWKSEERKHARIVAKQHKSQPAKQTEENKDTFEYRNYIISGNERTGIIAIDNHGNFSPKVYKTVEEAKKAVDEDIEYAEKKYAEMEAEQTEVEETAETETAKPETAETDDSGFEYYSVETAYEVTVREEPTIVFKNYSEALEVAEHFTETWGGEKAIVIAVNFVIRNDRQPTSERDKRVLEDETAEIEMRCVPYNYLGLRGYVSIEDKRIVNEDIA